MSFDRRRSAGLARLFLLLLIVVFGIVTVPVILSIFGINIGNRVAEGPVQTATPPAYPTVVVGTPDPNMPELKYRLIAEKANVETLITQVYLTNEGDWDLTYLRDLAGHLEGTAPLGREGNVVLAGHVELEGGLRGPFVDLKVLQPGDLITILPVSGDEKIRRYAVTETKHVAPNDMSVIKYHGFEELTLLTCDNFNFDTNQYETRFIVHARPVDALRAIAVTPAATAITGIAGFSTP